MVFGFESGGGEDEFGEGGRGVCEGIWMARCSGFVFGILGIFFCVFVYYFGWG